MVPAKDIKRAVPIGVLPARIGLAAILVAVLVQCDFFMPEFALNNPYDPDLVYSFDRIIGEPLYADAEWQRAPAGLGVSPDGSRIAIVGQLQPALWVYEIGSGDARLIDFPEDSDAWETYVTFGSTNDIVFVAARGGVWRFVLGDASANTYTYDSFTEDEYPIGIAWDETDGVVAVLVADTATGSEVYELRTYDDYASNTTVSIVSQLDGQLRRGLAVVGDNYLMSSRDYGLLLFGRGSSAPFQRIYYSAGQFVSEAYTQTYQPSFGDLRMAGRSNGELVMNWRGEDGQSAVLHELDADLLTSPVPHSTIQPDTSEYGHGEHTECAIARDTGEVYVFVSRLAWTEGGRTPFVQRLSGPEPDLLFALREPTDSEIGHVKDLDVAPDGRVYIADEALGRINVYDPESDTLQPLSVAGGLMDLVRIDITEVAGETRIVVFSGYDGIRAIDVEGNLLQTWAYSPSHESDLVALSDGRVIVLERFNSTPDVDEPEVFVLNAGGGTDSQNTVSFGESIQGTRPLIADSPDGSVYAAFGVENADMDVVVGTLHPDSGTFVEFWRLPYWADTYDEPDADHEYNDHDPRGLIATENWFWLALREDGVALKLGDQGDGEISILGTLTMTNEDSESPNPRWFADRYQRGNTYTGGAIAVAPDGAVYTAADRGIARVVVR